MNLPVARLLRFAGYGAAGGGLLGILSAVRREVPEGGDSLSLAIGTILGSAAGGAVLAVIAVAILIFYKR